jgi:hypothetical protein
MEIKTVEHGKVIGNVGIVDLRNATEASISNIARIENAGLVIYSLETAALLPRLRLRNVGGMLEVPAGTKIIEGQMTINTEFFQALTSPVDLVVAGQLMVQSDISTEDVQKGLGELSVAGQIYCPEHLAGIFQSKMRSLMGQFVIYPSGAQLIKGKLDLDENTLRGLTDGSSLAIVGALRISHALPNDLLEQKIGRLQVMGSIRCPEENVQVIQARLANKDAKITSIPAGFELVEKPLTLDSFVLESLQTRKLYCTGNVRIDPTVEPSLLDSHLEALICKAMVLCPARLRGILAHKIDPLKTKVIFYEGELWLVDGEARLSQSRFDYLEDKAVLVVTGELSLDPALDPKVLASRLSAVHNSGEIRGTVEQIAAIQARLGLNEGELIDTAAETGPEEQLGNIGHLVL